jgi:hypothetical protein
LKRLHEFIDNEYSLLLDFPLYSKISIETTIEEKYEREPYHDNEGEIQGTVDFTYFIENRDFQSLKNIFANEKLKAFHYCPFCCREVPIVNQSSKNLPEEVRGVVLTQDVNISSEEQYEGNVDYSKKAFKERYRIVRDFLFDENGILKIELNCTANEEHKFNVIFMLDENGFLTKIGQSPSIRDFDNASKRYKSIIKDKFTRVELNTSIGLKSHGIGIGSFVYLRRIFERLIYEQYEVYLQENPAANKNEFPKHMHEKIDYLKDYLPPLLVKNKNTLYAILSKGIHQLSEKECLDNYDTVYAAIIIILEKKLESDEKRKKEIEVNKALQKTHMTIEN